MNDELEPILKKTKDRYSLFPIKYPQLWKYAEKAEAALWTANEIDFGADLNDWASLDDKEQMFIKNILAFFAGSDGIVMENLMGNFNVEIECQEAKAFYAIQTYIEYVHSKVYSLMIDTFVKDKEEKNLLFDAINTIECVGNKSKWVKKWMNADNNFAQRLVGFVITEGLFFAGSFCAIFWLKNKNKMTKALGKSNELIARDEKMHADFGILICRDYILYKLDKTVIYEMFNEAIEIEKQFICDSLNHNCKLLGMNSELMFQYIKYVADKLINDLGYEKLYNVENPFDFMINFEKDIQAKTNFFEERVTEYKRASSVSDATSRKEFNNSNELDDDF